MVTIDQGGARADTLHISRPAPALAGIVDFFWVDDDTPRHADAAKAWRIVADDSPHLVYSVSRMTAGSRSRLSLIGARATFEDIDLTARVFSVGVRLRPGMLSALFGIPAHEVTDTAIPVADVLPRALRSVARRIGDDGMAHAAAHIGALLRALSALAPSPDHRTAYFASTLGGDIDELARSFGISHRALRAWSRQAIGMGAKRVLRIQRLHRAVQLGRAHPSVPWSEIAARAHYGDQSHCIRDFRDLLGETPRAFLARGERR